MDTDELGRDHIFLCVSCDSALRLDGADTICTNCRWAPSLESGKPSWIDAKTTIPHASDFLDGIKKTFKRFPKLYSLITTSISPVYPFAGRADLARFLAENSKGVILNIGSGADRLHERIINLDIQPFAEVDALVDATALPIRSGSVDAIVSIALLEHVLEPRMVATEIIRLLKPNGVAFIAVPFIQGFHASPHDYHRYTLPGLIYLFRGLKVENTISSGPTGALVWIASEWFAVALSFGSAKAQAILAVVIGALLSPLKYLDSFLRFLPGANNISTAFTLILRKVQ